MNKKELVKLLFKHPTIKALYESGHFNAKDINRAILTEVTKGTARKDRNEAIKDKPPIEQKRELEKRYDIYKSANSWVDLHGLHPVAAKKTEGFNNWKSKVLPGILTSMEAKIQEIEKLVSNAEKGDNNKDGFHDDPETREQQQQVSNQVIDTLTNDEDLIDQSIKKAGQDSEGGEAIQPEEAVEKLNKLIGEDGALKGFLNNNKEFMKALAIAYVEALVKKESESSTASPTIDQGQQTATESINRALSGIFLLESEEGSQEASKNIANNAGEESIDVEDTKEVLNMLEQLKQLFDSNGLSISVEEIWKASKKKEGNKTDADTTEASQDTDPEADADVSPMEPEELDKEWIRTLDIFFGKNPESPSFMRRLLLKDQATMLFTMIDTLKKIELGKSADGEEQSLTNQRGKFDNKDEQPTSDKEVDNSQQQTQTTSNPAGDQASLQESLINEIFNKLFKSDNQEIKISKKTTAFMRQDLESMVNLLQSLKADIKGYERFATRSSSDPRYDGTTLKAAMDGKLETTQKSIAHLIKVIDVEIQNQINQLGKDAQQVAGGDTLQEDRASDRKLRIQEVEKVYNELRRMYLKGLRISLENPDTEKAKAGAKQMREYVMGEEKFMSYFPTNIISGGKVMTLGDAYEKMSKVIRKFIETIRDIVTITKTQRVSKTDLEVVVADLVAISLAIQSMFRKESLIDRKFIENYKNEIAQNPNNQSLTSEEPAENLGLAGKGLEKLKQMFGWMSDEIAEFFNKFFGEGSGIIKALKNSDASEGEKLEITEEVVKTTTWFDSLEDERKTAVGAFSKTLIDKKRQLQEEEETFANLSFINDIARDIEMNINDVGEAYQQLEEEQKGIFKTVVKESFQELVGYLKGVLRIQQKLGAEASEELINKVLDEAAALEKRSGLSNNTSTVS